MNFPLPHRLDSSSATDQLAHLDPHHRHEWQTSLVDDDLVHLNVTSLDGEQPLEMLLYNPHVPRRNDGRLREGIMRRYAHLQAGGWWIAGLDPLNGWEPQTWGRFKPDHPRTEALGFGKDDRGVKPKSAAPKPIKYESPLRELSRLTYCRLPLHLWQRISDRYRVPMPPHIVVRDSGEALGFWQWVQENLEIPIILTEGEKKAACLLSQGFVAVALPGIWNGTRQTDDGKHTLHPDLLPLLGVAPQLEQRRFIILFDHETKLKTQRLVRLATLRLGDAIAANGGRCEIARLPGPQKGVDDWAFILGHKRANAALTALVADALTLDDYKAQFHNWKRGLHKYKPSHTVHSRYLSDAVQLPRAGVVGLLSDMGTGKTELLSRWRTANPSDRFLNLGHRVNLLKNLADRLQTEMYSALNQGDLAHATALSMTADSLWKLAQNRQVYGCVFVDEACQFIAHLLHSKTCKDHQAEILDVLEWLVYNTPLLVIADAHLDDLTLDFFMSMRPEGETPYIIENTHRNGGRDCHWYEGTNSSAIVQAICAAVWSGKKAIISSDSKRFIKKLEAVLQAGNITQHDLTELERLERQGDADPSGKVKLLVIHGDNSGSPENVENIKSIRSSIFDYDALLHTPSIGTGVDMPDYHFEVIFGVFHAVTQTATECVQSLWRYRPTVPMHVWVAPYPPFGYKPTNPHKIEQQKYNTNLLTAYLIRIDPKTGGRGAEKDWALKAHCQLEAQRNFSLNNLRADLRSLLESGGNTIIPMGDASDPRAKERMKQAGQTLDERYCAAVAAAELITKKTYDSRQTRDYLNPQEWMECEKYRIHDSYGKEVTPELVALDDKGKLLQRFIALEEALGRSEGTQPSPHDSTIDEALPPALVTERDRKERERLPLSFHWKNHSAKWLSRHKLGIPALLYRLLNGAEITADDRQARELKDQVVQFATQTKTLLNLTLPPDTTPMWMISQLLEQLGLKLTSRKVGARGEQERYYRLKEERLTLALEVLDYRQRQREERDRQRQEADERNAAHAAAMQTQYGIQPVSSPPRKRLENYFGAGMDTHLTTLVSALETGVEAAISVLQGWSQTVKDSLFEVLEQSQEAMAELQREIPGFDELLMGTLVF